LPLGRDGGSEELGGRRRMPCGVPGGTRGGGVGSVREAVRSVIGVEGVVTLFTRVAGLSRFGRGEGWGGSGDDAEAHEEAEGADEFRAGEDFAGSGVDVDGVGGKNFDGNDVDAAGREEFEQRVGCGENAGWVRKSLIGCVLGDLGCKGFGPVCK